MATLHKIIYREVNESHLTIWDVGKFYLESGLVHLKRCMESLTIVCHVLRVVIVFV